LWGHIHTWWCSQIGGLEQGIPYYFRVSAMNANGQGPAALASPAFALPLPQVRPAHTHTWSLFPLPPPPSLHITALLQSATAPTDVLLAVVDGSALAVSLGPPERDGGEAIDRYRVQYATAAFAQEVQAVRVDCAAPPEVQVVATSALPVADVQIVLAALDDGYDGASQLEVQQVRCDATGGSFTLTFLGETTADILATDSATEVQARLNELSRVNSVNVTFGSGVRNACADCGSGHGCDAGFNVTFQDVVGLAGDMPLLGFDPSGLDGHRRVSVHEAVQGQAGLSGSFRLTFRGFTTRDVSYNATAADLEAALEQLDPIPYHGGVQVTKVHVGFESMWRVTFVAPEVNPNFLHARTHSRSFYFT
jgi:hypothetical protein